MNRELFRTYISHQFILSCHSFCHVSSLEPHRASDGQYQNHYCSSVPPDSSFLMTSQIVNGRHMWWKVSEKALHQLRITQNYLIMMQKKIQICLHINSVLFIKHQITTNVISRILNNTVQFKPTGVQFVVIIIQSNAIY